MNNKEEKIFFTPGDLVILKQDLPNKPIMIVSRIERSIIRKEDNNILKGVKVRWFTQDGFLQEAIFSTKDLVLYEQ